MTDRSFAPSAPTPPGDRGGTTGPPRRPGSTHPSAPPPPRSFLPLGTPPRDGSPPGQPAPVPGPPRADDLRGATLGAALRVAARATVHMEEVDAGRRPVAHLRTLLEPALAQRWTLLPRAMRPARRLRSVGPVQVRRLSPRPSCNLVLLVEDAGAVRPVGLELTLRGGNWFVSDVARPGLEAPPDLPPGWESALSGRDCPPLCRG